MFVLDVINDSVLILDDKIILPEEAVNLLNNQWVWEVYFNNMVFDMTPIYVVNSDSGKQLVVELNDEARLVLGWQNGDEVTWIIGNCAEGPEVKIYKF